MVAKVFRNDSVCIETGKFCFDTAGLCVISMVPWYTMVGLIRFWWYVGWLQGVENNCFWVRLKWFNGILIIAIRRTLTNNLGSHFVAIITWHLKIVWLYTSNSCNLKILVLRNNLSAEWENFDATDFMTLMTNSYIIDNVHQLLKKN